MIMNYICFTLVGSIKLSPNLLSFQWSHLENRLATRKENVLGAFPMVQAFARYLCLLVYLIGCVLLGNVP